MEQQPKPGEDPAPLREAILTVGSRRKLARLLGISGQAIAKWGRIPAEHVIGVERASGISRRTLRPDIFGQPEPALPKMTAISDDKRLHDICRRSAARAIYGLLARDPDILNNRDAAAVARRLAAILHEELNRK